jgi:hypothetical protein
MPARRARGISLTRHGWGSDGLNADAHHINGSPPVNVGQGILACLQTGMPSPHLTGGCFVQSALQQTQDLLMALAQQNAIANQNAWESALQQQFSLLTGLGEKYGQQASD